MRKVYPQLIANKITGVQPLSGPTGLVHYLKFRYSANKGNPNPNPEQIVKPVKKPKEYRPIDAPWEPAW